MKKILKFLLMFVVIIGIKSPIFAEEKPLIVYFSYYENSELPQGVDVSASASIQVWNDKNTGNTGFLANMIAEKVDGHLQPILVANKYPADYREATHRGRTEQMRKIRPRLVNEIENFSHYDTIYLGFPIWWRTMPMAVFVFFDSYNFSGKTIVPFMTNGGLGHLDIVATIKSLEPEAKVFDGINISGREVTTAEEAVTQMIKEVMGK